MISILHVHYRIQQSIAQATPIMSLEAARELSIPELLRVLNEKIGIEHSRVREMPPPLAVSAATRELEVRARYPEHSRGV